MSRYSQPSERSDSISPSAVERDSGSLRGFVIRIEAEVDALLSRLFGIIQNLETAERTHSSDLNGDFAVSTTLISEIESKINEVRLLRSTARLWMRKHF